MSKSVVARIDEKDAKAIDRFAKQENLDKSATIRRLLASAIKQKKLNDALDKYRNQEVTLWKAASLAEIPVADMMLVVADNKISINYTKEDLSEDFHSVFEK